jgi:type IV pilus assembly protein PilB
LKLRDLVINRLKILSSLDLAERRVPQDGRIKLRLDKNSEVNFRVSVRPTLVGENVILSLIG